MAAILYSKIETLCMHIMALIDTELIYLDYTLIELRNNLHISIETEVRTHIIRILILRSQQIPLLRVYEVLITLIILTIALIDLVTFHLMICDIIYVPNACIIEQNYMFFTSVAAILNISNCSMVATCHPPGIVH